MSFRKRFFLVIYSSSAALIVLWCASEAWLQHKKMNDDVNAALQSKQRLVDRLLSIMEDDWMGDMRILAASIVTSENEIKERIRSSEMIMRDDGYGIVRNFYFGRSDEYAFVYLYNNRGTLKYAFQNGVEKNVEELPDLADVSVMSQADDACFVYDVNSKFISYECVFKQSSVLLNNLLSIVRFSVFNTYIEMALDRALIAANADKAFKYAYVIKKNGIAMSYSDDFEKLHGIRSSFRSDVMGGIVIEIKLLGVSYWKMLAKLGSEAVGMFLLAMFASYVLALYLAKYVSKPIEELVVRFSTAEPAMGRFEHDEFKLLAAAAEKMKYVIMREGEEKHLADIGKFIAHIAHDIRSPISVLKTYVKVTADLLPNDDKDINVAALRSVDRLQCMANDLVESSKAQQINRTITQMKRLYLESIVPEIDERIRPTNISKFDECHDIYALVDSDKICRVLVNVLLNAVQAVDPESGIVKFYMINCNLDDLVLKISDNGRGIEKKDLNKIFDAFFTTKGKHGTGLGLAYCKQVVEAHGGTIDVESEVGKGTTFTIRLPNCIVDDPAILAAGPAASVQLPAVDRSKPERASEADQTITAASKSLNLIIADDDSDMLLDLARKAQARGATIAYQANAAEEIMEDGSIDYARIEAAIVDYEYKGSRMNGIDLARFLKSMGVKSVHLCTGHYDDVEVRKAASAAGVASILKKPLDEDELARIL